MSDKYLKGYLEGVLAEAPDAIVKESITLDCNTGWFIIDMQNDFFPKSAYTEKDGSFAVAEGDATVPGHLRLLETARKKNVSVFLSRDYHPEGHCSFIEKGGPFPAHCRHQTDGSRLVTPIVEAVTGYTNMHIVFKGCFREIDSFSAIRYPDSAKTHTRLSNEGEKSFRGLCRLTGGFIVCDQAFEKSRSNAYLDNYPDPGCFDENQLTGENHGRLVRIDSIIKTHVDVGLFDQIIISGLAGDYCVMDTACNLADLLKGQNIRIYIVIDLTRFAWLPGSAPGYRFKDGSFLTDPGDFWRKISSRGIRLIDSSSIQ